VSEAGAKVRKDPGLSTREDLAGGVAPCTVRMRHAFPGRRSPRLQCAKGRRMRASRFVCHRFGFQRGDQTLAGGVARPASSGGRDAHQTEVVFSSGFKISRAVPPPPKYAASKSNRANNCCEANCPRCGVPERCRPGRQPENSRSARRSLRAPRPLDHMEWMDMIPAHR